MRNTYINPADWGFSPDPYEEMTIVSGLGIEEARQVKELYPGSIIRFQRRTAKGQYGYRVAENGEILPVFNRAPGQVDDGDIYEVVMPQVATEMPPPWPELKFDDEGKIVYGQQSEAGLWPEKEKDPTFDLEAWLAEKTERERQIREWYTTTYVPGQQAAGSTEIRSVDYFLGLYGGTDTRGSWAKIGDDLTFRHPPEPVSPYSGAMPPGGFSAVGPQGVTEAQDLLGLLAAEGIDMAANEAALVEAVNNLVGGAAGVAQNIGSSQGGWQGFINRLFSFVGGGGSLGGGGVPPVPPASGSAAAAAAMPPGGSAQPFLTNLTQPWQPPLLYGPPKGPPLAPGGEYAEVAGPGSRVEWSQDLSQLRRYGELDDPWRDFIPWGDSRSTRAVRATEEFDLLGSVLLGTGAGSAELAVLLNRLALDPTSLITGIDSAFLPKLMSQADGDGIWRLGAGTLGNMDMARALPLLDYAGNDLMDFSARLAANYYGENIDFNQFKDVWGQIFSSASQRFFGTGTGDNVVWRGVNAVGDVQRSVLAEANLSLNPQVWAGNAISANYINAVEGYGTFKPLDELEAGLAEQVGGHVARSRDTVNAPTVRTQGALEGKAVGSGAFLGLESSSMLFRPRRWVDSFIDLTMGWWASDDLLKRVDEGLDAFALRFQDVPGPVRQPTPTAPYTRTRLDDLLSTDQGYHAWRERELGFDIEGPAPASSSDPAWNVLAGGAPNLSPEALRLANLGSVGAGQPGQAMGFRALLEKYNPFAPFASISEGASNLWTGMTTTMAGRVPIGEQANYFRTFAQANTMARRDLLPEAFGPVVARGEQLFGADDPVIQALTGEYVRNQMLTSNRYEIGESLDAILQGMVDRTDPNYARYKNFISRDLLGTFDEFNLSALKAAKAGADNVMLEPTHKTNFDEWVSPFLAFAYFGIHNAYNWIGRSVRDPGPLRNFLLFERATAIQNENQDVPTRYEGMLEGPFGWYYNNPMTSLTGGLNRLAPNPIGQEQLAEAETPQELLLGMAGAANQRFLPFYDAALRGDMSVPKLAGQFSWQIVAADQAMRSLGMHGIGVTTDEFTNYRAGRYLGAETLAGNYSPATGLMGQQVLYEEQWDVPEEYRSDQVAAVGDLVAGAAKQAVAAEELARTLVRTFLLPFGVRPPVNEGEILGAQLSKEMQAVGPSVPGGSFGNMDVLKGENPGWYAWAARGLLYPESDERPQDQPIDNLKEVIPGGIPPTPSVPPPAGWEPPVWDTSWGRYMDGPDDSPYAEEGDTTALYVMVDPITGLIRYVGQSIHPSERYVQHMEQFKEDGFDHPKTKWEASLYAQGTYPRMYVFDWQPGTVADRNDEADKAEQRWIGFLRYEVGIGFEGTETGDVNKDVPDESVWRALMEEAGQTPEMYWQIFRSWPETLDPVRLDKEPNIDWNQYSPFPGQPLSPEGILLLEANPPEQKRTGEDFSTWIKGVTLETDAAIHAAGVTTWQELADVATDPVKVGEISKATGKSVDQVLKWAGLAATTVAIQRGQMPMQIPEPEVKKEDVPAVGAPGSVSPSATYDPLSSARLTATASTTTGAPNSATVASSGMLGTSLTPAWMPSAAQGTEPYRVYSEEQLTEGIARLSLLNQLAIDEGYGTSAMSRPQLQRSYEFVQDVTRTYPFKSSARDYLLDNVYTYVYDLESKTGGGYYDIENNVISLQTAQEEGAIHEMSHAYWNTLREEELGEGVTYAGALAASLQMTGKMMEANPDAYDPELAVLVDEYLVGNKEGTFTGFYSYGEGRDAWIDDHEIYAGLASWAMGDIDLLPESLRPYYEGLFEPSPAVNYREAYLESGDAYDNRSLIGQAVRVAAGGGVTAEDFMPKADTAAPVSVPPQSGLGMPSVVDAGASAVDVPGWDVVAPLHTVGVPLDPGLAQQPYRPTTGPQASAPAGGLTGMAQTWLRAGQRALGNLFRLGQAANAQVGAFTTTVNQYLTMMERTGGEGASGPVQAGPQVSTKYYYLPGWGATVRPGEEFWLPELPDGAQFWMPANMIRFRDSEGYPDPDYQNNPMFDRTQPGSFERMQELYGPLQPVPLEYLMAEPAYMGPGSHSSFDQPRLVAGGRKGLQGNPYGVEGAGGMYTTIGAPDPRENPVEYANWQALIAEPRGDYGIWLDTPYSGNRTLTQGYGENPESYARFGTAGHTGLDWAMKEGSEIYAAAPGMVTTVGYDEDGYGNYVIIGHDFGQTLYGHLGGIGVEQGQYLATGDLLGLSGSTGNSTGGHLHFELILPGGPDEMQGRVDPTPYLPGSGQPSAGGWLLTDVPGVSAALAAALVDAGVTTPEQLAGLAPLPGQSAPPSSAELAHWLDVNVINQAGRDAISAQQGWNLVAGARALLQMGPKPVKEKEGEGSAAATPGAYGEAQEGGTPLRPGVVPGLGEKTIETLNKAGITTFEQLSGRQSGMSEDQWIEELIKLDDIGPATAEKLVTGTKSALSSGALTPSTGIPPAKEGDTPLRPGVVAGLGEKTIETLKAAGITTFEQLSGERSGMSAEKWMAELEKLPDIGPTTAEKLVTGATVALAGGALEPMGGGPPPAKEGDRPLTPGLVDKVGVSAIANLAALPTPITTVEQLAATSPDWLDANVKDFGPSTALAAYTSANEIAQTPWDGSPDLVALPHVGEKKAAEMREAGYGTRDALETVSPQRFGFDMGMNVEKAREVLNAFRAQVGLPELTPEIEAALQAKEGVTPEDFEWLSNIGPTNEEKLYAQGTVTEQALYDLGISGIKGALGITDQKALEIYNELRVKRGEEPIDTVQEARDVSDPKIPIGQEAGMLGITGATNDQQILLQAHNIQTLQDLIDEDPDDIATWLGIEKGQAETLQERARKDIAARGGGTYFDPDALKMPGASPYAATRTLGPVRDAAAVAAGWRRLLREEKVEEPELEPKPDKRLELGDTVEKLQATTEDPGRKAVEVTAARKPEMFSRENKSGSGGAGVNMDELEAKLLERLRGRLTREVFSEFEKVLAV
ncbi:MAG: peptidoglycan DD-metalloendopeptidase family protein [Caldilinea sp.]|nr:peptidoglycan DD-metalloendopeptidase family protein [Caldilinea sp.]